MITRPIDTAFFCAALLLAACKDRSPPPATNGDAAPISPTTSASGSPAGPHGGASGASALDDLLHFTDARIGVSSKVDNPRDFAEHVADGRLDSAWNGKTGDLVGGWIGFRVPAAARVKLVELTVGYVATSKKGEDLFAMNHRIARVRITRDGVSLGEHALDPDSRAFQRIAVDAPGGDFKIEVLAVKPGSRAAWKELVMSELRVFGLAGAAKRGAATIPHVHVGSLDAAPAAKAGAPPARKPSADTIPVSAGAATLELECTSWLAPITSEHASMVDAGSDSLPWLPPDPSCGHKVEKTGGDVKLVKFTRSDLHTSYGELAIQRGKRLFVLDKQFDQQSHFDPHCTGSSGGKLESARIEGDTAIFVLYHWSIANSFPQYLEDGGLESSPGFSDRSLEEIRCVLGDAGAEPTCKTKKIAEKHDDSADGDVSNGPAPLPW